MSSAPRTPTNMSAICNYLHSDVLHEILRITMSTRTETSPRHQGMFIYGRNSISMQNDKINDTSQVLEWKVMWADEKMKRDRNTLACKKSSVKIAWRKAGNEMHNMWNENKEHPWWVSIYWPIKSVVKTSAPKKRSSFTWSHETLGLNQKSGSENRW